MLRLQFTSQLRPPCMTNPHSRFNPCITSHTSHCLSDAYFVATFCLLSFATCKPMSHVPLHKIWNPQFLLAWDAKPQRQNPFATIRSKQSICNNPFLCSENNMKTRRKKDKHEKNTGKPISCPMIKKMTMHHRR